MNLLGFMSESVVYPGSFYMNCSDKRSLW